MAQTINTAVVYRSPFQTIDGSPTSVTSPRLSWNPRDEVFRRFSDPASDDERKVISSYVRSAELAYNNAVKSLQVYFKKEDVAKMLSPTTSTKEDLHRTALGIQRMQKEVTDRNRTGKLVAVLDHYQGVFDILSQADFSYLPLLWGGLKFILVMSKNHSELLIKITDMMIDIGLNLQRVQVYAALFPTTRMLEMTADLYAAIVEFLEQIIAHSQKKSIKRYMASFWQPFDLKFDRLVSRIERIHKHIEKDANVGSLVIQMIQSNSLAKYRTDLELQRSHLEESLKGIAEGSSTLLFQKIKKTLFRGFESQAGYHEELAKTYRVTTSDAWDRWFRVEQEYVPSGHSHETKLLQAECDAPDPQHALQWVSQQRKQAPQVPSAYLIWTRGMTAQSAVGSLVFQILAQKPQVLSMGGGLDMRSFGRANTSIKALWELFLHLARLLGGCCVYISFGSVGEEEFALVGKFVRLVKTWDGPAVNVTLIHPFDERFERADEVVDLDEKYDVVPSLTITDALHHVLLLELNVHDHVSETVHTMLWETVWREVRYAVIAISLAAVVDELRRSAAEVARDLPPGLKAAWDASILRWTDSKFAMNPLREQLQRHLNIVPLHYPSEPKSRATATLKRLVFSLDHDALASASSHPLSEPQRDSIWDLVVATVRPGAHAMFCEGIAGLMARVGEDFEDASPASEKQARGAVSDSGRRWFGGGEDAWRATFSGDEALISGGIAEAIDLGLEEVVKALARPVEADE